MTMIFNELERINVLCVNQNKNVRFYSKFSKF